MSENGDVRIELILALHYKNSELFFRFLNNYAHSDKSSSEI